MICYFASRSMDILAHASTRLREGLHIKDDKKTEDIEAGQDIFSGYLCYGSGQRAEAEAAVEAGNYILRHMDGKDEFYTVIDTESDPLHREIYFYAESAGLDLIGEVLEPFEAKSLMTMAQYMNKWIYDTGYEIGVDESGGTAKMLAFEDTETATARIISTAAAFGCEVSFRFDIDGFSLKHKYIDFYQRRGSETVETLRRGKHFEDLRIKKSVANIATALRVKGGTPDGSGIRRASDDSFTWVKYSEYAKGRDAENQASITDDPEGMQFIGISPGHATDDESEDPDTYLWGMIRKATGIIATPSASGHREWKNIGGKPRYTWVMFATDENGSNMSDQPTDRSYIGLALHKTSATKGALASQYTWYPMNSNLAGRDVFISPGTGAISEGGGLYTWIKYADDANGNGISDARTGKKYIGLAFHQSSSTESSNASLYDWQEITLNSTDGGITLFNPCYPGIRQSNGTFIWIRFAADSTGGSMAGTPNNRPYLGLAYDKTGVVQSRNAADYDWSLNDVDESGAVTLKGMTYDDGDFWIDSVGRLRSESALERWSRYISPDETGTDVGHIVAEYESDATDQQQLLEDAIAELTRRREPEITYELKIVRMPEVVGIGDTVRVADSDGDLYLTSRILKIETSDEKGKITVTLGDYTRSTSSLSDQIANLARQQQIIENSPIYTWVVYADSPTGDGIRLNPEDADYRGVSYNNSEMLPDLSDPFAYEWERIAEVDIDAVETKAEDAKKTATNYISADDTGLMVADLANGAKTPSDPTLTGSNVLITAGYGSGASAVDAGVKIRDGQTVLASFGENTRIGKEIGTHLDLSSSGMDITGSDPDNSVHIGAETIDTVTREEDWEFPGYTTDDSGVIPSITVVDLPAELVMTEDITVTIVGGSTHTFPAGTAGTYSGIAYAIDYDGAYTLEVENLTTSTIEATVGYTVEEPTNYTMQLSTPDASRIKVKAANSGTRYAEGGIYANDAGNFGLFDAMRAKWVCLVDANGNTRIPGLKPILITGDTVTAPATQMQPAYATANLKDWAVIGVYAHVNNTSQLLIFLYVGSGLKQYISDTYVSGNNVLYFRGGFWADWTTNRVYVTCANGPSNAYQYVKFNRVFGLLRK